MIGVDDAGTEHDGRHVPLTRRPETHDEPHRTGGKVPLVVMRDDRRVEQRRGLDRILRGQVGSDEQAAIVRKVVRHSEHGHGRAVVFLQHGGDAAVAGTEFQEDLAQQLVHLGVIQAADAIDDALDPCLAAGIEEPSNDAANITGEDHWQTPDLQGAAVAFSVDGLRHRIMAGSVTQDLLRSFHRCA